MSVVEALCGVLPIFGVCRGHQAIGEGYGADVVRAPELLHGKTSQVHHHGDGVLAGLPDPIAGDLGDLAAGLVRGRERADERLFCLNLGMALEDVVTGELALRRARELGVGTELPL